MQPKNSRTSFGPLSLPGLKARVSRGDSDEDPLDGTQCVPPKLIIEGEGEESERL